MTTQTIFSATKHQEGGDHYKHYPIQLIEFVHHNRIPYAEGSIIYYVCRWRDKGGIADLRKARHTLDLMISAEENGAEYRERVAMRNGATTEMIDE